MTSTISPEKYIRTKVRNLPLGQCYINELWKECGLANIIVPRMHTNGNTTLGIYMVDIWALGTKDCIYRFNLEPEAYKEILDNAREASNMIEVDYALVHNIIYGANDYAKEYGFKISKGFKVAEFILMEDNDSAPYIALEFGKNGEPFFAD